MMWALFNDSLQVFEWDYAKSNNLTHKTNIRIAEHLADQLKKEDTWEKLFYNDQLFLYLEKGKSPIIHVDLKNAEVNDIMPRGTANHVPGNRKDDAVRNKIFIHNNQVISVQPYRSGQLLLYDWEASSWVPYPIAIKNVQFFNLFKDQSGNLLGLYERNGKMGAVLQDQRGGIYDYSKVISSINAILTVVGKDFQKQAFVGNSAYLQAIEVVTDLNIRTFFNADPLRWLEETMEGSIIAAVENTGLKRISAQYITSDDEFINSFNADLGIDDDWLGEAISDSAGNIWRIFKNRLCQYNQSENIFQCYPLTNIAIKGFEPWSPIALLSNGQIACFTQRSGNLYFFDPNTQRSVIYQENDTVKQFPLSVHCILQIKNGNLLLATETGLLEVNYEQQYTRQIGVRQSVYTVYEDGAGDTGLAQKIMAYKFMTLLPTA